MNRAIAVAAVSVLLAGCSGGEGQSGAEPETRPPAQTDPAAQAQPEASAFPPGTASVTPPPDPEADESELASMREYTQMFYDGKLDLLHARFTDEMSQALSLEQLNMLFEKVANDYGAEKRVIGEERVMAKDPAVNAQYRAFVRWAHFDKTDEIIEIQWFLKPNDDIAGFFIEPAKRKIEDRSSLDVNR